MILRTFARIFGLANPPLTPLDIIESNRAHGADVVYESGDTSKTVTFGPFQIVANEYPANLRRVFSGDPLGVVRSIWFGSRRDPVRWYYGFGTVRPWVHLRHVQVTVDGRAFSSEIGAVEIHPPITIHRGEAFRMEIRNDSPQDRRNPFEPILSGNVALHWDNAMGAAPASYNVDGVPSKSTANFPAAVIAVADSADLSITAISWTTSPAGADRRARLFGKPEWYA